MMVSNLEPEANELVRPTSLEDARAQLAADEHLRPMGGGTAIVPELRAGSPPGRWLSTTSIDGLDGVSVEAGGDLVIGAGARLRQIEMDPRVHERWPLLATAIGSVAGPAIRNAATIGGSLALGRNSPDPAVALDALDAHVTVMGGKTLSIGELPTAESSAQTLLIEQIRVPASEVRGWDLRRFTVRGESDRPFVIVAVAITTSGVRVRVAVGRPRPVPLPATAAAIHAGGDWHTALDDEVEQLRMRNTDRGSGAYRSRVLAALTVRAIDAATTMARDA